MKAAMETVLSVDGQLRVYVGCKSWTMHRIGMRDTGAYWRVIIPGQSCLGLRFQGVPAAQCPACEQFSNLQFSGQRSFVEFVRFEPVPKVEA